MNFTIDENGGFDKIVEELCVKDKQTYSPLKEKYGKGGVETFRIDDDISIIVIDFELKQPLIAKWDFKSKEKNEFFLNYNLSEKMVVEEKSDSKSIEQGAVMFTQNNYRMKVWVPGVKYRVVGFQFTKEWLDNVAELFPLSGMVSSYINKSKSVYLNSFISVNSKLLIEKIVKEKGEIEKSLLKLKVYELIYMFFQEAFSKISYTKKDSTVHPDDLAKISEFVNSLNYRILKLPNISEAALELSISESKFQRLFKKVFRKTYYAYILKLKMNLAVELLNSGKSVSEVAFNVGYSSVGNFTMAFKSFYNQLPSEVV